MKYTIILLASIVFSMVSLAQEPPMFIISTTKVYNKPSVKESAIGVYARGGSAEEIKKLNNGWSRVIVENGDTGFLPSKFLATVLNAKDKYEKDPADFVLPDSEDAVYGSPHLFVTGASVKGRAIFAKGKPVIKLYRTNEPVGVSYLPYNENGLVKVGGGYFEKNEMVFIPKKYLGKKLNFATTLNEFKNTKDAAAKKQLAERIYEMSWLENKTDNLLGVQTFRNYVNETGNKVLYDELAFEEFLLRQTLHQIEFKEQQKIFEKNPTAFAIKGKKVSFLLSEKDIENIRLPKKVIINTGENNNYPECGVEITKEYRFDNFKIYQSGSDNLNYIPEASFKNGDIALSIAGFTIDQNTTEEAFIKKLGGLVSYTWLDSPHIYTIPDPDAAAFVFYFKNGKIEKMEYFFYC